MSRRPLGAQRTMASEQRRTSSTEFEQGQLGLEVLMVGERRALDDDDPVLLLRLANHHVWVATHRMPPDGGSQMMPHHGIKNLACEDRGAVRAADHDCPGPQGALPIVEWLLRSALAD